MLIPGVPQEYILGPLLFVVYNVQTYLKLLNSVHFTFRALRSHSGGPGFETSGR